MPEKVRTTIVPSRELLRRAKVRSAQRDKNLSQLVAEALDKELRQDVGQAPAALPIGKYRLKVSEPPSREEFREEFYVQALRAELPA